MRTTPLKILASLALALLAPPVLQAQTSQAPAGAMTARVIVKFKADSAMLRQQSADVLQMHAGRAQALDGLLRHRLLQAAARIVGAALRRRPACDEGLSCMRKRDLDGPERYADESRDLAITIDDQLQRRRLHAPHRQHAGIAGLPT